MSGDVCHFSHDWVWLWDGFPSSKQTSNNSAGPSSVDACCKTAVPALIPQSSLLSGELFSSWGINSKVSLTERARHSSTAIVPRTGKYKLKHFAAAFLFSVKVFIYSICCLGLKSEPCIQLHTNYTRKQNVTGDKNECHQQEKWLFSEIFPNLPWFLV